jgi:hypothetical protein
MLNFREFIESCPCQDFTTGPSKIHGTGIIIMRPLKRGTCLGTTHKLLDDGNWEMLKPLGNYNHSTSHENAFIVKMPMKRKVILLKDLFPGDEMLVDFRKQPDLEQPQPGWIE